MAYKGMNITILKLTIIVSCVSLTSCATNYYTPANKGTLATVSFSNISPEIPEIRIIENCNSLPINQYLITRKDPAGKSKLKLNIPTTKKITFEYNYHWLAGEKTEFITKRTGLGSYIETEKYKEIKSCVNSITFIPSEDKHYEISFGINNGSCKINANEAIHINGYSKYRLLKVDALNQQQC